MRVCEACYIICLSASPCRVDELHQQLDDLRFCSSELHLVIRGLHHTGCTCKTSGFLLQLETSNATSTTAHTIITITTGSHMWTWGWRSGSRRPARLCVPGCVSRPQPGPHHRGFPEHRSKVMQCIRDDSRKQACIDIALHFWLYLTLSKPFISLPQSFCTVYSMFSSKK